MHTAMRVFFILGIISMIFNLLVESAPQQEPEINDQFNISNHTEVETKDPQHVETNWIIDEINVPVNNNTAIEISDRLETNDPALQATIETPSVMTTYYIAFKRPIVKFIRTPKVSVVLKNIGTCLVNGAMEIVSYYFPAPLIPLIASAAGMIIPFEPVVMLRNRMPVTSYRRAFNSAMNSFMGTFDRFKTSEEDPYMTRRFNRRFMGGNSKGDGD